MPSASTKPVIFISYSHKDEPEKPRQDEIQWLSFVRTYLQPAVKHGVFDLWVDRHMPGGADWNPDIETKLRACDIFMLLVSANAMASDYIVDKEIAIIRERQAKGEPVHFYPLLLTPTPKAGLDKVKDKNLRPRDGKPLSGYSQHDRAQHMTDAADEIAALVQEAADRKSAALPSTPTAQPGYVHIAGLPETAYERLVGRDAELWRLDEAWADANTNILSLIAEGGAGKSALVNEWLKRLQADGYRDIDHPTIRCSDRHQRQTARERRKRAEGLGRVCAPARQGGHCRVAAVGELQVARRYAADLLAVRAYCFRALSRTVRTSRPTRQVDERWSCPDAGVRGTNSAGGVRH